MKKNTAQRRLGITLLGNAAAKSPASPKEATLETFPNQFADRDYTVTLEAEDFTSLCPVTGQPDFAAITISYVPDRKCVETKSLKFYLGSYRNERAFNEEVVNRIFGDLWKICEPRWLRVEGEFSARGGVSLSVEVERGKEQ